MGKRGPQPGSGGRPKRALADKVLEGNPGKRELTAVQFSGGKKPGSKSGGQSNFRHASAPPYLDMPSKEGAADTPSAVEIYRLLADWIDASSCGGLIAPHLLEDFANLRRGYLECEAMNRKLGRVMSNGKRSPYTSLAMEYEKSARQIYNQIWQVLSQNSETRVGEKNEFLQLLTERGF